MDRSSLTFTSDLDPKDEQTMSLEETLSLSWEALTRVQVYLCMNHSTIPCEQLTFFVSEFGITLPSTCLALCSCVPRNIYY